MHPNASESGSYIKASIFPGFYSRDAIAVTYLLIICMVKTIVCSLHFTLTEPRLDYGWVAENITFFAILSGLFN